MYKHSHLLSLRETDPLISILVSNYNYDDYLFKAINSCLNQDYNNTEIIICDDGSTDSSHQILSQFKVSNYPSIKIIEQENGGQASALNTAFSHCKGEIITFLDSDDYYYPNKISHVVQAFQNSPDCGFLIHRLDKIGNNGRKYGQLPLINELPFGWYVDEVLSTGSAPEGFPVTSALALRREIAEVIFPINPQIVYDVDELIRRLALLSTKVCSIDESLGAYRIHGNNMTAMNVEKRLEKMLPVYRTIYDETKKFMKTHHPEKANKFPHENKDVHYLLMNFVLQRLQNDDKTIQWKDIQSTEGYKNWSTVRKIYWSLAIKAPSFLFKQLVNLYWNSEGLKLQISKLKLIFK